MLHGIRDFYRRCISFACQPPKPDICFINISKTSSLWGGLQTAKSGPVSYKTVPAFLINERQEIAGSQLTHVLTDLGVLCCRHAKAKALGFFFFLFRSPKLTMGERHVDTSHALQFLFFWLQPNLDQQSKERIGTPSMKPSCLDWAPWLAQAQPSGHFAPPFEQHHTMATFLLFSLSMTSDLWTHRHQQQPHSLCIWTQTQRRSRPEVSQNNHPMTLSGTVDKIQRHTEGLVPLPFGPYRHKFPSLFQYNQQCLPCSDPVHSTQERKPLKLH